MTVRPRCRTARMVVLRVVNIYRAYPLAGMPRNPDSNVK